MNSFSYRPCLFLLLFLAVSGLGAGLKADDAGPAIRAVTGHHTRVVWVQDAGPTACVYVEKPTVLLMGIDSDDGKGEHPIIPAQDAYYRPLLTADGQNIVYTQGSNASGKVPHSVWVVPFAGGTPKMLMADCEGEDVWTDPDDGVTWVYGHINEKRGDTTIDTLRRFRLDNPSVSELVWDKFGIGHFQLGGSGYSGSGGSPNGGQGLFRLPNDAFSSPNNGCWPSASPDFSDRIWIFTGNHRWANIYEPVEPGAMKFKSWPIDFSTAPGIPGNCEVYHPRWSNNVRFMTMTGPYATFNWASDAKITNEVAAGVEVYLGRFSEDLHKIEQWVQVTHNQRGDYFPDAWIEPEPGAVKAKKPPRAKTQEEAKDEGLRFLFTDETGSNQVPEDDGKRIRICSVKLTGNTRYGHFGALEFSGSPGFGSQSDQVIQACKAAGVFSFSATVNPGAVQINSPATIASFCDPTGKSDFALTQLGGRLQLFLSTGTNANKQLDLGEILPNQPVHVSINFAAGQLSCYLDGRKVMADGTVPGDVKSWTANTVVFGADANGSRAWMGNLSDIAIRSRVLDDGEASSRAAAAMARIKAHPLPDQVIVDATMVGHSPAADPKAIAPYVRCLSMSTYNVTSVVQGKLDAKQIAVFQWSVLDSKRVPEYEAMKPGDTRRMTLELFSDRPEMEPERQTNEVDGADTLPLYYDVGFATPAPAASTEVTWTGKDGQWSTGTWSKPGGPSEIDRVLLDTVTSPRTITLDQATKIAALAIHQTSAVSNSLVVNAPLRIQDGTAPELATTGAGAHLRVVNAPLTVVGSSLGDIVLEGSTEFLGDGGVHFVHVYNGGYRYTTAPKVTFTGTGTGASGQATLSVSAIRITHLGSGYKSAPTATFSDPEVAGGHPATGNVALDGQGAIDHIDITNPGQGYIDAPTITIDGGGGSGGGAQALCSVSDVKVISPGSGYTTLPAVTLDGGNGSGAAAIAHGQQSSFAYTTPAATVTLINKGTLVQDGSVILLDRASPTPDANARAAFRNEGTWTINHGGVDYVSSTGISANLANPCANSGTMNLLDGSALTFKEFTNTGTMKIVGGARLSSSVFATDDVVMRNGAKGTMQISGGSAEHPTILGFNGLTPNGSRSLINGGDAATDAPAQLEIGNGHDNTTVIITGSQCSVTNQPGGHFILQHGALLNLQVNDAGGQNIWRTTLIMNHGKFDYSGGLRMGSGIWGPNTLDSDGTVTITGDATYERMPDINNGAGEWATLKNRDIGIVTGDGTLTFTDSANISDPQYDNAIALELLNSGTIMPLSSKNKNEPATLTFIGVDLNFDPKQWATDRGETPTGPQGYHTDEMNKGGTLVIKLTDSTGGCDKLVFKPGTGATKGGGVSLSSKVGSTLDLHVTGTLPKGTYTIISAAAVNGKFAHLLLDGKESQAPYTVNYTPTTVEVVFP